MDKRFYGPAGPHKSYLKIEERERDREFFEVPGEPDVEPALEEPSRWQANHEKRRGPVTFDEFLAECLSQGIEDDDRISYIEWDIGRPLEVTELTAGKAIRNKPMR